MIDQVYKTLQTILNKENSGYVSPLEFNILAKQVQDNIFRSYFEDENRDKNRENKGLSNSGYANLSFNERQRISKFVATSTISESGGNYPLADTVYFIEDKGVTAITGEVIEEVEKHNVGYLNNSLSAPSEIYPVYEQHPTYIKVLPASITTDITVRHVTKPLDPKWTYRTVDNNPLYDPTQVDFQDFELHESEFSNIVLEMLTYFSINLRESEVVKIAEQLKQNLNINDNA